MQPYGEANGRDASWTIYLLGRLVLAIGSLLFGIAAVRAAVVLPFFGALIFAIPFTWLGYTLWSGNDEPVGQVQSVR